jgi:hypothetical protein
MSEPTSPQGAKVAAVAVLIAALIATLPLQLWLASGVWNATDSMELAGFAGALPDGVIFWLWKQYFV